MARFVITAASALAFAAAGTTPLEDRSGQLLGYHESLVDTVRLPLMQGTLPNDAATQQVRGK